MSIFRPTDVPKPYSAELSFQYGGVEIKYAGETILIVPHNVDLNTKIVNALNGAFMEGCIHQYHVETSKKS